MSIAKRKEKYKEDLRKSILKAAKKLFLERGFHGTSIRNIAEQINYSPTTIYLYFKDKDDLFYALHTEGFELLGEQFKPLLLIEDPLERIRGMGHAYIRFSIENSELYDLMFIMRSPMDALCGDDDNETVWDEGKNVFNLLLKTIDDCQNAGYFSNMKTEELSYMIWSTVHGMCSLLIRKRLKVLRKEGEEDFVKSVYAEFSQVLEKMQL